MLQYLIRRILWACVLFIVITMVSYVIFFIIPVNPAALACGQRATADCIKNAKDNLRPDKPVYEQYGRFVWRLVGHQDLGKSYFNRQNVNQKGKNAYPLNYSLVHAGYLL